MPENAFATKDEVRLWDLCKTLWREKWILLAVVALFTASAVTYALLAPEWYRAEVLLAPAEETTSPALAGQFGGLAALAGVSIGGDSAEAIAFLRSREFARSFAEEFQLLDVFYPDGGDGEGIPRFLGQDRQLDVRDATRYLHERILTVSEDRRTRLITLTVDWKDPEVAAAWANALVERANASIRERALREAELNVEYLQAELARANMLSVQQAVARVLESELQKLMLARGKEDFAFRVVDPAYVPKERLSPKRKLIVLVGAALGALLGVLVILLKDAMLIEKLRKA
jgi:uncharacterized protein involved in exopolysaccharide biosynthesis